MQDALSSRIPKEPGLYGEKFRRREVIDRRLSPPFLWGRRFRLPTHRVSVPVHRAPDIFAGARIRAVIEFNRATNTFRVPNDAGNG